MAEVKSVAWRAGLVAVVGLLLVGCGGGASAPQTVDTPAAPTATQLPASIPTRASTAEATVGPTATPGPPSASGPGRSFYSPLYGYSITVPKDWEVGPGAGKIGSVASDLYKGAMIDGFQTNVNIVAQNLPQNATDTPSFFRTNVR